MSAAKKDPENFRQGARVPRRLRAWYEEMAVGSVHDTINVTIDAWEAPTFASLRLMLMQKLRELEERDRAAARGAVP